MTARSGMPRQRPSLAAYAVPFLVFMVGGWYGMASIVQAKRDLRVASRGLDAVEELDPVERMRRRYGLDSQGQRDMGSAPVSSLDEELESMKQTVDIRDFDYKPVPRPVEDD